MHNPPRSLHLYIPLHGQGTLEGEQTVSFFWCTSLLYSALLCSILLLSSLLYSSLVFSNLLFSTHFSSQLYSPLPSMYLEVCVCESSCWEALRPPHLAVFLGKILSQKRVVSLKQDQGQKHATTQVAILEPCLRRLSLLPGCDMLLAFRP